MPIIYHEIHELPLGDFDPKACPKPNFFVVTARYLGRGSHQGSWVLFKQKFTSQLAAERFCESLNSNHYVWKRIYHLG